MKTLKLMAILIAVLGIYSFKITPQQTTVELSVGDYKSRLYVHVLNQKIDLFKDSTGVAVAELDFIKEPCIALVEIGSSRKQILLKPGSKVRINRKSLSDISFEGDDVEINNFLNERIPMYISKESYKASASEFMKEFDKVSESYSQLVDSKPELKEYSELIKQNRSYLLWYSANINYKQKEKLSSEESKMVLDFLQAQDVGCFRFPKAVDAIYRGIRLLYEHEVQPDYRNYNWVNGTLVKLNWLDKNIANKHIKQHFVHADVETYIQYDGIDRGTEVFKRYKEIVDDHNLLDKFNTKVNEFKTLARGREVPVFEFVDAEGQKRHLSELKGSYVYIDVWATWCGHCIAQFPYLKELKKEYKDKNIVFLGVNNDRKLEYFTNYLDKHDVPGDQWYILQYDAFMEFFEVMGQPRFILLDPQGKIYDAHMLRADNKTELIKYLNNLEGI